MYLTECSTGDEVVLDLDKLKPFTDSGLVTARWRSLPVKVISPTSWNHPESWISDSNTELDYVLKKVSVVSPQMPFVDNLISSWKTDK